MSQYHQAVIKMNGITKKFGNVIADEQVDFELLPNEIHGLLGENGAGKSTLMNILYGLFQPDHGEILVDGKPQQILSPHHAIAQGIGMVHQHFMQVPTLTVLNNVILGLQSAGIFILDRKGARKKLNEVARIYGLHIDPDAFIWQLSIGDRQRVEILKALYRDVKVLILDEPTSVLTPHETDELFNTIRSLVNNGLSVIFITHNLEEAIAITDRVTVLRDARTIDTLKTAETTKADLARLMVGRDVLFRLKKEPVLETNKKSEVLCVENLCVNGDRNTQAVHRVSFRVHSGEIVGVAGVDGNGQSELAQALTGLRNVESGSFFIAGKDHTGSSPQTILEHGMGHIPENLDDGLIGEFTLVENMMLNLHYTGDYSKYGVLDDEKMVRQAKEWIDRYDVRTPNAFVKARTLSGGNKQKLIVGRELSRNPRILIAAHPTRGIDIGAEEYIRNLLLEKRQEGMGILLISTKLDEILSLSDRILVMERGRLMGQMSREEATVEKIGMLMTGVAS